MRGYPYILTMFVILLVFIPGAQSQAYPGEYTLSMDGGTTAEVSFAIFNERNQTVFFSVYIPNLKEWRIVATPSSGILHPHTAQAITLKITAPKVAVHDDWSFNIKVVEYNSSGKIGFSYVTLHIHLNIKTLGMLYFHISFPEAWGYWGGFINSVLFWVIADIVAFLFFYFMKKLVLRTKTKVDDVLLTILRTPVTLWIIVYGIFNASLVFPLSNQIFSYIYLGYDIFTILVVTWLIYRIYRNLIIRYAFIYRGRLGKMEGAIISALDKVGVMAIVSVGGIMLLQAVGIDVTVLLASMGVLGIVLGFAAQDTIGNFFSGIHILLDRSVEVGDYILLEGDENVYLVKDVGLRSTKLYDIFANTIIFLPNNIIANHKIINLSRPDSKLKLRIDVGVSYASDVEKVKKALLKVAEENEHIIKEGEFKPVVIFREFGESSLNFRLYLWIDDLKDQWMVQSEIREAIVNKFREMGIEIPFPQVDVHIKR